MDKPLVTFGLLSYNQESYIREAVEAALAQTYSPLEIIISDDCSKDRTFEIMQEIIAAYRGPHTIILRKNEKNLGLADHINTVMALAKGEFIVGAAGDDISVPWRTEVMVKYFQENPQCVLLGSYSQCFGVLHEIAHLLVDEDSKNLATRILTVSDGLQGSTLAYRRSLIESFPPLETGTMMEDAVYAFRAWEIGTFELVPEVLILYRTHYQSISSTQQKADTIAYQLKLHGSVIDQLCLDLKSSGRPYQEIAPGLISLRKRELQLLESCVWNWRQTPMDKLRIWWLVNPIRRKFMTGSILKKIRRNSERKSRKAAVVEKWRAVRHDKDPSRRLPDSIKKILTESAKANNLHE